MVLLSTDDLLLVSAAAMRGTRHEVGAPPADQELLMRALARCVEMVDVVGSEDPIEVAARLAAQVTWQQPLGNASDRTALLAMAVLLDQGNVMPPRDWAGCAELIKDQRGSGMGPGARTEQLQKWLESAVVGG